MAPKIYDVFLSFRGEDTRYTFTDQLLKAIEDSRSSVIIFSKNYAHSRWCLDELVKIMDCQKDVGHTVFPIFYHMDPSQVRNQTGRLLKRRGDTKKGPGLEKRLVQSVWGGGGGG